MLALNLEEISLSIIREADLAVIMDVDKCYFPYPWSDNNWVTSTQNSDRYSLIKIKVKEEIVGFILFYLIKEDSFAHLQKIVIVPEMRGLGVAKELLSSSVGYLRSNNYLNFYLEVEESNQSAIFLYESFGFSRIRLVPNFYGRNNSAITMKKNFSV